MNEIPSSLFIDSLVFDRIGMFNPRFRTAEDSDFHLRIKDAGIGIKVMDDKLLDKHIHGENISQNIAENRKNIALPKCSVLSNNNDPEESRELSN